MLSGSGARASLLGSEGLAWLSTGGVDKALSASGSSGIGGSFVF